MAPHADGSTTAASSDPSASYSRFHAASTKQAIAAEDQFAAHNYHPLPVVFARAQGVHVWDPEGKHYLDFLSAYSAVNQGHCHPELVKALTAQAGRLTLSSRAFHNDVFPVWAEKVRTLFGYDMVLPMNTGAEAVETAIKIARKWAYKVKGVPQGRALVFGVEHNFHGRTLAAISLSTDPESRDNYGPYVPGISAVVPSTGRPIRYNNVDDVAAALAAHGPETAAFVVEPIQGEAGVVVPDDDYLARVHALCRQHNVLLVCDEIQTGVARTGRLLCSAWAGITPDLVTLGKALAGGMYPVSAVLGSRDLMLVVEPGTHGSTFGGNPLGCAVSLRALELVEEEQLAARAEALGRVFRDGVATLRSPLVQTVRGKGLLNAVVIDEAATQGRTAWDLCLLLKDKGVLAKPTHGNIIRFAPPLVITDEELRQALAALGEALKELPTVAPAEAH
ncbi:ornithine aminotransferase [Niveomyces insectorum RCEF 264]|uniref:Ornithine aminotransferase n=1 Tax=Niveomyces insectorum RCEF 264 TaxID=1081102 RepID=A0A167QY21_9HYPO|nr:ornithine aminotransferase [Niveomyces insectorum RCEF 264]